MILVALILLAWGGGHCRVLVRAGKAAGHYNRMWGLDAICYTDTATESL